MDPRWLTLARADLGVAEVPGKGTAPVISRWLLNLKAWWQDDETPWCGVAVAHWMRDSGIPLPKHWYRAKGWLDWGVPLAKPLVGCVVVFEREGGGHVGIVVGRDQSGFLMVLGGNQGNRVSIMPFSALRVVGYRWPKDELFYDEPLPLVKSFGGVSTQEA